MNIETERKFTVDPEFIKQYLKDGVNISQGYLASTDAAVVRVRLYGNQAFLTIKSAIPDDYAVEEYEYEIPFEDGSNLLKKCESSLSKVRYLVVHGNDIWEVDVFNDADIIVAEFEHYDRTVVDNVKLPSWVTQEVTNDPWYSNYSLAKMLSMQSKE